MFIDPVKSKTQKHKLDVKKSSDKVGQRMKKFYVFEIILLIILIWSLQTMISAIKAAIISSQLIFGYFVNDK